MSEEFSLPCEEAEFRPPSAEAEFGEPSGGDHENPDPALEFDPPGSGRTELPVPQGRRRALKRLLYGAFALVLLGLFFGRADGRTQPTAVIPTPLYSSASDIPLPSAAPTAEQTPEPVSPVPEIRPVFFSFSHEHHGRILLGNTSSLRSVSVSVREKLLDEPVYDHELSPDEIASGRFELPVLSTGTFFEQHMDAFRANDGWPEFEMKVEARYTGESGGEETLAFSLDPEYELGISVSYMRADYTWSETVPPDSFVVSPWAETDVIRYVINDPGAVKDPLTFSVDLSYNGRHAAPEEFETVVEQEEYTIIDRETNEQHQEVFSTKKLVLRRPDWIPESGALHVVFVQRLASTGEIWTREFDLDY